MLARKDVINGFFLALGYGIAIMALQFFLYYMGVVQNVPDDATLLRWDAGIYEAIARFGYTIKPGDNTSMYVLLPLVWHLLHVGVMGISLFNLIFFSVGFAIVAAICKADAAEKILWLSVPSMYFMWVPYTEALFSLLTALSFYAIINNKRWLIWLSLFLVALTRATAVFLIPALLIMELITANAQSINKALRTYFVDYFLPITTGLATFVIIQYVQTGIWFPYYIQQSTSQGHVFSFPVLPFADYYGGQMAVWLNAVVILVCLVALIGICIICYKRLVKQKIYKDKILILTLAYLPAVLFAIVFYNPTWGANTTNLHGLHRYTLCTPFIFIFLHHYTAGEKRYTLQHVLLMLLLSNLVWLSMGSYLHIRTMLYYNFTTLLVVGYMMYANKRLPASYVIIAFNVFMQVMLYQRYLANGFTD
jgi:hypothetical protein